MTVKLVGITQPVVLNEQTQQPLTPEQFVAYIARVSSPNNQQNTETAPKLIKYLIEHKHWSPMELVSLTVEINTTRAISAQILRHKSFSFQEQSLRYTNGLEFEVQEARRQNPKNRQDSIDDLDQTTKDWFISAQNRIGNRAFELYNEALSKNIAREQARFLLPLNTKTRLYMAGTVRSWIHYLQLRSGNGTQHEHMAIAKNIIKNIFVPNFPVISGVLGWSNGTS